MAETDSPAGSSGMGTDGSGVGVAVGSGIGVAAGSTVGVDVGSGIDVAVGVGGTSTQVTVIAPEVAETPEP